MRRLVLVPVLLVALICGTIVGYFVLPLYLVLHELVLWPLAFGVGALFAAIGAGWVGTFLASDQTRSRLLAVVGVSEATAAIVTVIGFLLLLFPAFAFSVLGILFVQYGLGMVVIALVASWATWRFRSSRTHMGWDAMLTLVLAGLAPLIIMGTLYVAELFGLVGA